MDLVHFNHFTLLFLIIVPIVLIARAVVSGTRYSPVLFIVVFGLALGVLMEKSGLASKGLTEFPMITLLSSVTIVALVVSFFVGGQELRKIQRKENFTGDDFVIPTKDEVVLGTNRTQLFFIIRSLLILLGVFSLYKSIIGVAETDPLKNFYLIMTFIGIVFSVILIDGKAVIKDRRLYIGKGVVEMVAILGTLLISMYLAKAIAPIIGLPQIFFAMILSCSLGYFCYKWTLGPTVRALLFAGIPIVLAANFLVGGSRLLEAFKLKEMIAVMGYGFFGQVFWMFGGLAILIFLGKTNHVRNLAPAMAGALSHSGLTGACTAGDLGEKAAARAPIMINIPFVGHIFVFSILAYSAARGELYWGPALLIALIGAVCTFFSLRMLRTQGLSEDKEIKALMLFSLGWQLVAVFGSFFLLHVSNMSINNAAMATSSALSHFGLFAATQGGMFGSKAADLIPFIFAMPFLVHPFVFAIFGKAMSSNGEMSKKSALILALIGFVSLIISLSYFA